MRMLMMVLGFFSAAALACGNPSCGGCGKTEAPLIETVSYALGEMGMEENADIRTAMRLYKKEMRSLSPQVPSEAFADGKFYPEMYSKHATPTQAVQAQIDLFETIYLILNDTQKKEFPVLMGMYQHHMQFAPGVNRMCDAKGPQCGYERYDNRCGSSECPPVPRKRAVPLKR